MGKNNYLDKIAQRGQLIVISGPSGGGKREVLKQYVSEHPSARYSVSATTRDPRPGEEDGKDYFFLSRTEFDRQIRMGQMLEHVYYRGNCYGTPKQAVEAARATGKNVILEVECTGAMQVRTICPDATLVFIMPPSWEDVEERLRSAYQSESEDSIQERLALAQEELACAIQYDYIIVNDTVEKAVNRFSQIVHGHRYSRDSMKEFLEDFVQQTPAAQADK